jgi:integrase
MADKRVLDERTIGKLSVPASGNDVTYDAHRDAPRGFGVRTTAAGARSFVLNYRRHSDGRERRMTIGTYPAYSVTAARAEAAKARREVDAGRDPLGEREAVRAAENVSELCDRFLEQHVERKRESTQRLYRMIIEKRIRPALGRHKVGSVTYTDIDSLHRRITKEGAPYIANRMVAVASKMFSLAVKWGMRPDNPVKGIERNAEDKRDRYLRDEEVARLTQALAEHDDQQAANIIRLLLLTGARRGEVQSMQWEQLDLSEGVWTKPASTTKQAKVHRVPLSAPARQLLSQIHRAAEAEAKKSGKEVLPYVFPAGSRRRKTLWRSELKDDWAAICKAAKIEGVRLHDLRHSYASILASSGLSLPVIGALLGHSQPSTTARYSHLIDDVLRQATDRVGTKVANAGKPASGKVVQLR